MTSHQLRLARLWAIVVALGAAGPGSGHVSRYCETAPHR